ncbi:hypothetical protein KPH14_006538 [Odynerus spinipes]|uniref:Uncharacterized protein n=1 Tax=Odynerus spinipes TaxID=1348599 RepID=A0AAD9RR40_9HYME|nr:hypothetical protein KPH14_006538 [Odynerus spinipes]
MCNCKHSTNVGEEHHSGQCPVDPSISVGEGWQSGYGEDDTIYRTARSNITGHSGMCTPKRRPPSVSPDAPIRRRLACDPELSMGVAIVQRLDFDDATFDVPRSDGCGGGSRAPPACPSDSRRSRRSMAHQMKQCAPRMTKQTPCGKCLRVPIPLEALYSNLVPC